MVRFVAAVTALANTHRTFTNPDRIGRLLRVGFICAAAAASLCIRPPVAGAQAIRPECARMNDKIGCTCALNHGGGISVKGGWFSVRGRSTTNGGQPNQAFTNCVARGGRG